jgi:hypothetical protein
MQFPRVGPNWDEATAFRMPSCLALALLTGCSAFNDLKLAGTCDHAGVPPRPSAVARSDQEREFTVALDQLQFGDAKNAAGEPSWRAIGFDLDGHCTGQGEGPSCTAPAWATAAQSDGLAGRDNAFGAASHEGRSLADVSTSMLVTEQMGTGEASLVIRVTNYNGLADDDQVKVEVIGARINDGATPKNDGTDVWKPAGDFVDVEEGGSSFKAKYFAGGYVINHVLVAKFRELRGALGMRMLGAVISARMVPHGDGEAWALADGVFGGRAKVNAMLALAEFFPGVPLCKQTQQYEGVFKPFICKYADILYRAPDDPPFADDPALPCDGVSLSFAFSAVPAQIGNQVDFTPDKNNCEAERAAGLTTEGDTCESLDDL